MSSTNWRGEFNSCSGSCYLVPSSTQGFTRACLEYGRVILDLGTAQINTLLLEVWTHFEPSPPTVTTRNFINPTKDITYRPHDTSRCSSEGRLPFSSSPYKPSKS